MAHMIRAQTVPGGAGGSQVFLHPPNGDIDVEYFEENGLPLSNTISSIGVFLTVLQTANSIRRAQAV
jgi:hypothetical protein